MKILFYGYGNPGRQDDGLGICFVEEMEKFVRDKDISDISFDSNYQLNIEDADTIKNYDLVFFCDAIIWRAVLRFDFCSSSSEAIARRARKERLSGFLEVY